MNISADALLQCIILPWIALHCCSVLYCIDLHCIALHCSLALVQSVASPSQLSAVWPLTVATRCGETRGWQCQTSILTPFSSFYLLTSSSCQTSILTPFYLFLKILPPDAKELLISSQGPYNFGSTSEIFFLRHLSIYLWFGDRSPWASVFCRQLCVFWLIVYVLKNLCFDWMFMCCQKIV